MQSCCKRPMDTACVSFRRPIDCSMTSHRRLLVAACKSFRRPIDCRVTSHRRLMLSVCKSCRRRIDCRVTSPRRLMLMPTMLGDGSGAAIGKIDGHTKFSPYRYASGRCWLKDDVRFSHGESCRTCCQARRFHPSKYASITNLEWTSISSGVGKPHASTNPPLSTSPYVTTSRPAPWKSSVGGSGTAT